MASIPTALPTTTGDVNYIEHLARVIAAAFVDDSLNRYFILSKDSLPNTTVISEEKRFNHFLPGIKKGAETGGVIVEAGDWAGAALWYPPDVKKSPPDRSTLPASILEYFDKFTAVKKKHLGTQKYWYLNLIGRHPDRHEPGVARALIIPFLKQAKEEGVPAYLEAITDHARDVYAHFGFRVVEVVTIGKGRASKKGDIVPGGEGIVLYAMIAEPKDIV